MPRELHIKGHVLATVNLKAADGEAFCHVLLDDGPAGPAIVAALSSAAIISDTGDINRGLAAAPAKYKQQDGTPIHQFSGFDPNRVPVISEPEHPPA